MRKRNECDCCAPEGGVCPLFAPLEGGQGRSADEIEREALSFGVAIGAVGGIVAACVVWALAVTL